MELYGFTLSEPGRFGTTRSGSGSGICALDLLELAMTRDDRSDLSMHRADGTVVTLPHVIAAARTDALDADAHEAWAQIMGQGIIQRSRNWGADTVATTESWASAGQWWADNVGIAPPPDVIDYLQSRDLTESARLGIPRFTTTATPPEESPLPARPRTLVHLHVPSHEPGQVATRLPGSRESPAFGGPSTKTQGRRGVAD
jgi:hypothetical protein